MKLNVASDFRYVVVLGISIVVFSSLLLKSYERENGTWPKETANELKELPFHQNITGVAPAR